jgi:hypothetical protein
MGFSSKASPTRPRGPMCEANRVRGTLRESTGRTEDHRGGKVSPVSNPSRGDYGDISGSIVNCSCEIATRPAGHWCRHDRNGEIEQLNQSGRE